MIASYYSHTGSLVPHETLYTSSTKPNHSFPLQVALFFLAACVLAIQAAEEAKPEQAQASPEAPRQKRFPCKYLLSIGDWYFAKASFLLMTLFCFYCSRLPILVRIGIPRSSLLCLLCLPCSSRLCLPCSSSLCLLGLPRSSRLRLPRTTRLLFPLPPLNFALNCHSSHKLPSIFCLMFLLAMFERRKKMR